MNTRLLTWQVYTQKDTKKSSPAPGIFHSIPLNNIVSLVSPWWKSLQDLQRSSKTFKDLQRSCKDPLTQGSFKDLQGSLKISRGSCEDLMKFLTKILAKIFARILKDFKRVLWRSYEVPDKNSCKDLCKDPSGPSKIPIGSLKDPLKDPFKDLIKDSLWILKDSTRILQGSS